MCPKGAVSLLLGDAKSLLREETGVWLSSFPPGGQSSDQNPRLCLSPEVWELGDRGGTGLMELQRPQQHFHCLLPWTEGFAWRVSAVSQALREAGWGPGQEALSLWHSPSGCKLGTTNW